MEGSLVPDATVPGADEERLLNVVVEIDLPEVVVHVFSGVRRQPGENETNQIWHKIAFKFELSSTQFINVIDLSDAIVSNVGNAL